MVLGKLYSHLQNNLVIPLPHTIYKKDSKWIKNLNPRPENIKLLEENLQNIKSGNDFLAMTPKVQTTKAKIDKWDLDQT